MTAQNREDLREKFKQGAIPSGEDFADFIDSGLNLAETGTEIVSGSLQVQGDLVVNGDSINIGTSTSSLNVNGELTVGGDRLVVDNSRSSVSIGTSTSAEPVNLYVSGDLRVRGTIHPEIEDTSTEPANLNVTGDLTVSNKLIQVKKYTISAGNTEKQTDYQVLEWICVIAGFDFQSSSKKNQVTQLSVYTEKDGDIWKIRANSMYPNTTVEVWVMAISTKIAEFIDA